MSSVGNDARVSLLTSGATRVVSLAALGVACVGLVTVVPMALPRSATHPPARDAVAAQPQPGALRWWKGNTHTHSLWSDGDGYPDMIADWYREHGYHFLAMTDHNVLAPTEERWVDVRRSEGGTGAHLRYRKRFGPAWVAERTRGDTLQVRLRTLEEYRRRLEERDRFLLIPGEEITEYVEKKAAHLNGINLAAPIAPRGGKDVRDILQNDLDAVAMQSRTTGQPILAHVNHPNYLWSVTERDLAALRGLRFFELYNGHPLVQNFGDSGRAGTERMWDLALAERLASGREPLYAVATDDAHDYHAFRPSERNPGRGWVVVRAAELTPTAIVEAMQRGDFYATTGVELIEVALEGRRVKLRVRAEPGVSYTTFFIGARPSRQAEPTTDQTGAVLATVPGSSPEYLLRGDESYVRARVVSSKPKANAPTAGEVEVAWSQPFIRPERGW